MEKMKFETVDGTVRNVDKIAEMFPQVVTEVLGDDGKLKRAVKWDTLKELLSGDYVEGGEYYEFTWPGKRAAIAEAAKPIRKTLRPCKEESKNWDTTENLYIEGDNLEVLKLLQESYLGKVKMIYIDPPYNTGNDFVYKDNFTKDKKTSENELGLFDEETEDRTMSGELFHNTESNGRFHSDWCSMIYPRLQIAKDLLTDDGVIFISIDDNEVDNLKKICDEIFGEKNFLGTFIVNSTPNARDYGHIGKMHEFIVFYGKDSFVTQTNLLPDTEKSFKYSDDIGGFNIHPLYNSNETFTKQNRPNLYYPFYLYPDKPITKDFYEIGLEKRLGAIEIYPPQSIKNGVQFVWRWGKEKAYKNLLREIIGYKTDSGEYRIVQKMRHSEKLIRSMLTETRFSSRRGTAEVENLFKGKVFSFPKPLGLINDLIKVAMNENSLLLDFFSGSATTAHAVMQLNAEDGGKRKFITVQLPEVCEEKSEAAKAGYKNICEIGKERIRRAGDKILAECTARTNGGGNGDGSGECGGIPDLDIGFRVFKVADSNMKDVYYSASDYSQDMLDSLVSNIKEDRTDLDLLYGCLLEWGVELSLPHTSEIIDNVTVHTVNNGDLIACFDTDIPESAIRTIAKRQPLRAVFRDSSFASAPQKINVEEIFKLLSPTTTVKVI